MAKLPEILVKEFVRMTNDTSKKKSESFLYGTVDNVNEDGTVDVVFDGADSSTPCTSSVSVAEGDRVLAMLKNRQAVITSNVSNPSINTEYLEAGEAKISGTIHAARYEDSTGHFTMDLASKQDDAGYIVPTFSVGGYINGDPTNKYLQLTIDVSTPTDSGVPVPSLWIEASVKNSPTDVDGDHVNMGIMSDGIHFNASWTDPTSEVPLQRLSRFFEWY